MSLMKAVITTVCLIAVKVSAAINGTAGKSAIQMLQYYEALLVPKLLDMV